ncbi:MAG: histidine kinase N-terminal domain-containing protein [Coriobacteriia bacterium]
MDSKSACGDAGRGDVEAHLENVAANLQLVADMGYGDVALAVPRPDGSLYVVADARPMTAVPVVASSRVGRTLGRGDEVEAYEALVSGRVVLGTRRRSTRGLTYATVGYPIGPRETPAAVVVRDVTQQVDEAPGKMERIFIELAEGLLEVLADGPLLWGGSHEAFSTTRRAGDGVLRIDPAGTVDYASPNAVTIMKAAGVERSVIGIPASAMPAAVEAVTLGLRSGEAHAVEVEVAGRVLSYREIALQSSMLVLVEDITESRRREQELKVKEATIREVHHRVKNNLQTIASLLRIQERRTDSPEATRALAEAVERVSSMAVVHEMLAASSEERVDFAQAARSVVDMVRQGLAGTEPGVTVTVRGSTGEVPASMATSLALVVAELVHNAIEHGLAGGPGTVTVAMRRLPGEVHLSVRDDGAGLPEGFDVEGSAHLGLAIVRTIVEDDLRGTLSFGRGRGTSVTLHIPLADTGEE